MPRFCLPGEGTRLEAVDRLVDPKLAGEAVIGEDLSPQGMDTEERCPRPQGLDRHQRRPGGAPLLREPQSFRELPALPGVLDQLAESAGIGRGPALRGFPGMGPHAVGQGDPEPALGHDADDVQQVGTVGARALHGAGGGSGSREKRALLGGGARLAEVVEADIGRRGRRGRRRLREEPGGLRIAIAEQAIADAAPGHAAQALHGAHQGIAGTGVAPFQDDRVERGEPAHGTRDVEIVEERLAAVPFQVHPEARGARPGRERPREGGEERLLDAGAIDRRQGLEQVRRLFGVELEGDRGLVPDPIADPAGLPASLLPAS